MAILSCTGAREAVSMGKARSARQTVLKYHLHIYAVSPGSMYDKSQQLPVTFARSNPVLIWQKFPTVIHTLYIAVRSACVVLHSKIPLHLRSTTLA